MPCKRKRRKTLDKSCLSLRARPRTSLLPSLTVTRRVDYQTTRTISSAPICVRLRRYIDWFNRCAMSCYNSDPALSGNRGIHDSGNAITPAWGTSTLPLDDFRFLFLLAKSGVCGSQHRTFCSLTLDSRPMPYHNNNTQIQLHPGYFTLIF